ncbi:acyltransferase family protein [Pseudokineococcus marinus]|uniref:Acyltransferase family protein n=1 Tax=Pseudokineococcus marinus TaxID=351215 RepID=A0A849BQ32_9ACTN|nr:acyltransferase family protein [Pseudokineococcus marinus]NNH23483.1 acyltransferase family protein [Pseudokineococcus marinus]
MSVVDRVPERAPRPTATRWMDGARVLAIVAVVLIHLLAPVVEGRGVPVGSAGWWVANALDAGTRWCVPVFVMISGALALDPGRTARPREYFRRRAARIGIPLVVWTVLYLLFRAYVLGADLTPADAAADVAAGAPFLQLYFLYVLAGLVLATPFLKVVTRHATWRMSLGLAVVLLGLGVLDQVLAFAGGVGEANAATRFLPFAGYYVLGWCLRDVLVRGRGLALARVGLWTSLALTALAAGATGYGSLGRYAYDFLSPTVVVASTCAYLLLHRGLDRAPRRVGTALARWAPYAFGVFLVHGALVYGLRAVTGPPDSLAEVLGTVLLLLPAHLLAATALTWVLLQVPYVRAALGESARRPPRRAAA